MSDHVDIILDAQDRASNVVDKVETRMLGLTKSTRLLSRETRGVKTFAAALDTIAGTNFTSTIYDLTTIAEVAHPLKELGTDIAANAAAGLSKVPGSAAVKSGANRIGQAIASGIGGAATALAATTAGTAVGIAVGGAAVVAIQHGVPALGSILAEKLAGTDAEGQARQVGTQLADHIAAGATDEAKAKLAQQFVDAVASGQTWNEAASAMEAEARKTLLPAMSRVAAATEGIWSKSAQNIKGDLTSAVEDTPNLVAEAVNKAQLAHAHPNALTDQEASIQRGIAKIDTFLADPNATDSQRTIYQQQEQVLRDQLEKISGQPAHGPVFGPPVPETYGPPAPTRTVYGPPAPQTYGPPVPAGFVPPHTHPIYIDGRKVIDALDPALGKHLALQSRAPYSR